MTPHLECHRCTACCRWPGEVRIDAAETAALAQHLGLDEREFIARHTRLRKDRRGLALLENPDGSCIFLVGQDCRVQPVKPQQCRDFPSRWVSQLWGKMPVDIMQQQYPMLFNCAAFQAFRRRAEKQN